MAEWLVAIISICTFLVGFGGGYIVKSIKIRNKYKHHTQIAVGSKINQKNTVNNNTVNNNIGK